MLPERNAAPETFARTRTLLRAAGFTADRIRARLGVSTLEEARAGTVRTGTPADACDALSRLFIEVRPLPAATVAALLPDGLPALLGELGLLRTDAALPDHLLPTVLLYPVEDLFLVSDLPRDPLAPDVEIKPPDDVVFAATSPNTADFLHMLPRSPCTAFLDIGTGTGVAALLATRDFADEAWATDITERAVAFAAFNARLNGLEAVRIARGDCYEPVAGMSFDCIVTHPPYIPSVSAAGMIFRDGGDDGEQIIRRIIAGLPEHLRPGGRFVCVCQASDREAPLEARVREWLGPNAPAFDVFLAVTAELDPVDAFGALVGSGRTPLAEAHAVLRGLEQAGVERLVAACIRIDRHDTARPAVTVRRMRSPHSAPPHIDWVLDWHRLAAADRLADLVQSARPSFAPDARVRVTHRLNAGTWTPDTLKLTVELPFGREVGLDAGLAGVLAACDGTATVTELYDRLRTGATLPGDGSADDFTAFVAGLAADGFLRLDTLPLPATSRAPAPAAEAVPAGG